MTTKNQQGSIHSLSSLPSKIAAVLVVLLLLNLAVLAWRWVTVSSLPPGTYHAYHISEWQQASIERPDDPIVWSTLGGLYDAAGEHRKALAAHQRAEELDPNNAAALLYLAAVDVDNEDWDRARARLLTAAAALPEGGAQLAYYRLGEIEETVGDFDKAIEYYEASVAERPTYWNAHFRIAALHERAGRSEEALIAAEKAARFAPDDDEVMAMLSRLRDTP